MVFVSLDINTHRYYLHDILRPIGHPVVVQRHCLVELVQCVDLVEGLSVGKYELHLGVLACFQERVLVAPAGMHQEHLSSLHRTVLHFDVVLLQEGVELVFHEARGGDDETPHLC